MGTLGLFLFGQREMKIQREGGYKAAERGRSRARAKFAAVLGALALLMPLLSEQEAQAQATVIATISVGTGAGVVGVNPNTNRIYVAHGGANTVSVIDGATNAIVATIPITSPGGVGVNSTTNRIYVSQSGGCSGQSIFVIDGTPGSPTENSVIATIPVPGRCLSGERGMAVNPNTNRIYVPSFDPGGAVIVIDGASNTVLSQIGVAANPLVAAVNPVTNKIYVGHGTFFSRTRITIIDGATNAVSDGPVVGLGAGGIGVNPATNRIYVHKGKAAGGDPPQAEPFVVVVIDGANNAVLATIPVGTGEGGVGVNPTTNRIYVANISSDNVSVIDITPASPMENTVVATVGVGSLPWSIGVNPLTSRIYVANIGSNTVSVIEDLVVVPFSALTAKVEIELGPLANDDALEVKATFTLGEGSDGIAPLAEDVKLQVGIFSTTIPAGSFKVDKKGRFKFKGVINGVALKAAIRPLPGGSFVFKAEGQGADLTGTANPVTLGLTIGDDGGSTTVTAEFE